MDDMGVFQVPSRDMPCIAFFGLCMFQLSDGGPISMSIHIPNPQSHSPTPKARPRAVKSAGRSSSHGHDGFPPQLLLLPLQLIMQPFSLQFVA